MKATYLLILFALFISSCKTVDFGYVHKSEVQKQIDEMNAQFSQKLEAATMQLKVLNEQVLTSKNGQLQAAANSFYAQSLVFKTIIEPVRTDLVLMNLSEEGWAAVGHLMPDYTTMMKINERIAKDLDAAKTSLADLKKEHEEELTKNQKLSDQTKALEQQKKDAENALTILKEEHSKQIEAKQKELNAANDAIIAAEHKRANEDAARQAQIAKLSWGAGVLAALCLAAALFSPVYKTELGIAAGILAGAAVGVLYVEPWMVLVGFGLIAAGIIIWALRKFHVADKSLTALVNSNNEIREKAPEVYSTVIAPTVADYTSKYVKGADGQVTTVPDPTITKTIDSKLIATDRK